MEKLDFSRLKEEQAKAIAETSDKIKQLDKFKDDYEVLCTRLGTLADTVTHDVMVPFGSLAFMPGQLVHTNEITVLLGDNWFVERSAKQAAAIVERRISGISTQIDALKQQAGLLQPRLDYTASLDSETKDGELVEIREEYDEEKEKAWKEQHRHSVRKYRQQAKTAVAEDTADHTASQSDEALWQRLNQLEKQEMENHELRRMDEDTASLPSEQTTSDTSAALRGQQSPQHRKAVRWEDDEESETDASDDGEEDEDADGEDNDARPTVISFTHSTEQPSDSDGSQTSDTSGLPKVSPVPQSPGDIARLFGGPSERTPKSILKGNTSSFSTKVAPSTSHHTADPTPSQQVYTGRILDTSTPEMAQDEQQPFTGTVLENPTAAMDTVAMTTKSGVESTSDQQPRRVSKFKAQRMQEAKR